MSLFFSILPPSLRLAEACLVFRLPPPRPRTPTSALIPTRTQVPFEYGALSGTVVLDGETKAILLDEDEVPMYTWVQPTGKGRHAYHRDLVLGETIPAWKDSDGLRIALCRVIDASRATTKGVRCPFVDSASRRDARSTGMEVARKPKIQVSEDTFNLEMA